MLDDASPRGAVGPDLEERSARVRALTRINADDMLGAFGLGRLSRGCSLIEWLCSRPAGRFAREVMDYDDVVGERGLAAGGAWALSRFAPRWSASGQDSVPRTGPLIVVSNHPGLYDTILLFAAIPRPDLRVIAADRPFLRALPNTSRHLLSIGESPSSRFGVIREAARHLQRGGAILTFPGGEIEPDPAVLPGAAAALDRWSASLDVLARLAPRLTIVPAVVGGVLSHSAQHHPLTRIRRSAKGREWLGAMLQVMAPDRWPVTPTVAFGRPVEVTGATPAPSGGQIFRVRRADGTAAETRRQILAEARRLIEECCSASALTDGEGMG